MQVLKTTPKGLNRRSRSIGIGDYRDWSKVQQSGTVYQSEVHYGLGHQLAQEAELHLDFGDVRRFGCPAEGNGKQPSGAEHVLGPFLASWETEKSR